MLNVAAIFSRLTLGYLSQLLEKIFYLLSIKAKRLAFMASVLIKLNGNRYAGILSGLVWALSLSEPVAAIF